MSCGLIVITPEVDAINGIDVNEFDPAANVPEIIKLPSIFRLPDPYMLGSKEACMYVSPVNKFVLRLDIHFY